MMTRHRHSRAPIARARLRFRRFRPRATNETFSRRRAIETMRTLGDARDGSDGRRHHVMWLESERAEALRRADALRAKVTASRRLLSEELSRRRREVGRGGTGVGMEGRGGGDGWRARTTPTASPLASPSKARLGTVEGERETHRVRTERLRRETTDLNERLDDLRMTLERASAASEAGTSSTAASPTKPPRTSDGGGGATSEGLRRARETMKERYEKELRETRESARESCETLKSELARANEEAAAARSARDDAVEALRVASAESIRLAGLASSEEHERQAYVGRAMVEARKEFEAKIIEATSATERAEASRAEEVADLKARLGKAKAEFDAHRMAESDTLTSQIAQQTTIQHNLVEELTEAKSAELAAKTRIRELEARIAEVTSALDVVTKEMANAARDQNTAVLMKEQALNTSFDERELEMEESQKTLRDAVDRLTAESAERGDAIERLERELKTSNAALEESTKTEKESTARIAVLTKELEQAKADATRFLETSARDSEARIRELETRARELETELDTALKSYEKNENEYQRIIEELSEEKKTLQARRSTSDDALTLSAQNAKLKSELEALSKELSERRKSDDGIDDGGGGIFGAFLGGGGQSTASKKKIKELEALVESESAEKASLEIKLAELTAEFDALREKHARAAPSIGSFFGF